MFPPIFWLKSSSDILCLANQSLRCCVLTRSFLRCLLRRTCSFKPPSLNLHCRVNNIRSLRKQFWSFFFFGGMVFIMFNPHLPSGPVHPYQLDESISIFRSAWCIFFILILFLNEIPVSKHGRPWNAASDLGLHCLPRSRKWDTRLIWVKQILLDLNTFNRVKVLK